MDMDPKSHPTIVADILKWESDKKPWAAEVHGLHLPKAAKEEKASDETLPEELWRFLATEHSDEGQEIRQKAEALFNRRRQEEQAARVAADSSAPVTATADLIPMQEWWTLTSCNILAHGRNSQLVAIM